MLPSFTPTLTTCCIMDHVETNQCTYCDVISRVLNHHALAYPVAAQKGVADLCLYQLQCTCKCILRFSRYVAIGTYIAIWRCAQ